MLTSCLLLLWVGTAFCEELRISNEDEFSLFVNNVSSGTDYSETTVFLDSDLSLSEIADPIGDASNYFSGVFDGQGHIISDLIMTTSSQYTGLFGYSEGLTIRNVVLDSSCSISSCSSYNKVYIGAIIGNCESSNGQCNIENSVNMADVTFSGTVTGSSSSLYLGGITGYLSTSDYPVYVKNCANYGTVTHSGSSYYSSIGGIVGELGGSNYKYIYIYNCLNYGTITHSGTSTYLYLGDIVGYSLYAYIENCVSAGEISIQTTPSTSNLGSIVGWVYSYTYINYCYATSGLSDYDLYGTGAPKSSSYVLSYDNTSFELSDDVSVGNYAGNSLIGALNAAADYYILRDYSKWLLNKGNNNVNFTINNRTSPITMDSQIILLPSLATEGNITFDGWYNDDECTHFLESFEITGDTTLYGRFEENTNNYTITFDSRMEGVIVAPISAQFLSVVSLPSESIKEHCIVTSWETGYSDNVGLSLTMPAHNITLYAAMWICTHITTPEDFADFSKVVNSGTDYSGITIFLDSDLSLPSVTDPIGKGISSDYTKYQFLGVFDGQGHIISDLKINTSSQYTGLFGCSEGLTIRNVVLDSSCSMTNSFIGAKDVYVGGIIGNYYSDSGECRIENSVNMADITFSGATEGKYYYPYLGGIAGVFQLTSNYPSYVKNCANYGTITHSGSSYYSYIGGIVGHFKGYTVGHSDSYSPIHVDYIYNCLNYGRIEFTGGQRSDTSDGPSTNNLYIGGIAGYSFCMSIENCVSAGEISIQNTPPQDSYVGSIIGSVSNSTYIMNSFWTSDVGYDAANETNSPTIDNETSQAEVNITLADKLNNFSSIYSCNRWLLNTNNASVSFTINNGKGFNVSSQVVLLPDPATEGTDHTFSGWYTDATLTSPFTGNEVYAETTLHGMLCESSDYTVTLDVNGGNASSLPESHSTAITCNDTYNGLINVTRTGYTFTGWFTTSEDGDKVKTRDKVTNPNNHSLYAQWTQNNYTVTFNFTNGTVINATFKFNSTIEYPNSTVKEGYVSYEWDPKHEFMPAEDFIATIKWISHIVTIVFSTKDIGNDEINEINEIIKKFAGDNAIIVPITRDDNTITYIVKFVDRSDEYVTNFIESINNDEILGNIVSSITIEKGSRFNESDNSTTVIVAVVVTVVVVIIVVLIAFLGLFFIRRQQAINREQLKRGTMMRIANQEVETAAASKFKSRFRKRTRIYPKDYAPPSGISEALVNAGIPEDLAKEVAEICQLSAEISAENGNVKGYFTIDDAAAVSLYTFDFGGDRYEMNPYRILNKALRAEAHETEEIVKVRDILYLLMSALRKLPVVQGVTLYRGIREKLDSSLYTEGDTVIWPGFSSTSPDINIVKSFLTSNDNTSVTKRSENEHDTELLEIPDKDESDSVEGTLFIIDNGWGYNVQPYSRYPEEEEILLEPEREFEVKSVLDTGESLIVTLEMKNTKTILPKVFGEGMK